MNQIPNIEEEITKLSVEEYRSMMLKEMKEALQELQDNLPFAVNIDFPVFMDAFEKMIDGYADKIKQTHHQQIQKAREEVYKEVQVNAEQCYRDNGRGAFEPVRAVPLYKLFTN